MLSKILLIMLVLGSFSGCNFQLEGTTEETPVDTKENLIKDFSAKIKEERNLFLNTLKQLTKEITLGESYTKQYNDNMLLDVSNDTEKTRMSIAKHLEQSKMEDEDVRSCIKQTADVLQSTKPSFKNCEPKSIFWSTMRIIGSLKDKYVQVQMVVPSCLTMVGDNVSNLKQCLEHNISKLHEEFIDDMSSKKDTVSDFKSCIDEIVDSIKNRNASLLDDVKRCQKKDEDEDMQ